MKEGNKNGNGSKSGRLIEDEIFLHKCLCDYWSENEIIDGYGSNRITIHSTLKNIAEI